MVSATSSAAETSRLTRSQSSIQPVRQRLPARRIRPVPAPAGGIDEEANHPARRLAPGLDFDQIEAGVAHIGLSEEPQVLEIFSHAGLVGEFVSLLFVSGFFRWQKKGRARGPPFSKEATQFFEDASYNMAILQAQDSAPTLSPRTPKRIDSRGDFGAVRLGT